MHQDPNESHCSKRPQRSCGQGPPCSHSCSGEMGITTLCPKDSAPWHLPHVRRIYAYMGYHCIDAGVIYVTVYEYIYKENVSEHTLLLTKCYQNSLATKQLAKRKGKKKLNHTIALRSIYKQIPKIFLQQIYLSWQQCFALYVSLLCVKSENNL